MNSIWFIFFKTKTADTKKDKGNALECNENEKKIIIEMIFVWTSNTFCQGRRKCSLQRKTDACRKTCQIFIGIHYNALFTHEDVVEHLIDVYDN